MLNVSRLSLAICVLLLGPLAHAQEIHPPQPTHVPADITVSITQEQAKSFRKAFKTLAEEARTTFVSEGQPLKAEMPPEAHPDLKPRGQSLTSLAQRMAAYYGYDADHSGTVRVLRKRYEDPEDTPEITLLECAEAIREITQTINTFSPHLQRGALENSPAIGNLLLSFTPEEIQALADKEHGLPVAVLSPEQQQAIQQLILFFYVQLPTDSVSGKLIPIDQASKGDPQFCWRDINELHFSGKVRFASSSLFGYELSNASIGKAAFTVLSKPGLLDPQGASLVVNSLTVQNGVYQIPPAPDPTDPSGAKAATKPVNLPECSSLGQIVERLNARAGGHPTMVVDAALAPKRACIFGEQFTPPDRLLYALADLYGLRVVTDEKGRLCLTRPAVQAPSDFTGLYQMVQWVLPAPLLRAQQRYGPRKPSPLRIAAVRHLRTIIEPKLPKAKDGRLPLSALSSRENAALATALMADVFASLSETLTRPVPPSVIRFHELRLTGGPYEEDGRRKFQLFLAFPTANGAGLISGPGVGNMNFPQQQN